VCQLCISCTIPQSSFVLQLSAVLLHLNKRCFVLPSKMNNLTFYHIILHLPTFCPPNLPVSLFKLFVSLSQLVFPPIFVLSANLATVHLFSSSKSLVYIVNSCSPCTDRYGTPLVTGRQPEKGSLIPIHYFVPIS